MHLRGRSAGRRISRHGIHWGSKGDNWCCSVVLLRFTRLRTACPFRMSLLPSSVKRFGKLPHRYPLLWHDPYLCCLTVGLKSPFRKGHCLCPRWGKMHAQAVRGTWTWLPREHSSSCPCSRDPGGWSRGIDRSLRLARSTEVYKSPVSKTSKPYSLVKPVPKCLFTTHWT